MGRQSSSSRKTSGVNVRKFLNLYSYLREINGTIRDNIGKA